MTDLIRRADAIDATWKEPAYTDAINVLTEVRERIKALPSAEAVSMEEHIKELNDLAVEWKAKFVKAEKITDKIYDEAMAKVANECKECKERLQNLRPSAEAVHGWIPVEEQPPAFPCLVCDANGNQPSVPLGIVTITDEEHGEWHIDGRLWNTKIFFKGEWCSQTGYGNRIIAWMPLPKPYKGGDTE